MSDSSSSFRPGGAFRASAYALCWCGSELLHRSGSALECLAAGTMRRRDLQSSMGFQFEHFASSSDEVDEGLNPFEARVYSKWIRPSSEVLLIGCGAGRDLIGLAGLGHEMTGVEPVPALVSAARAHLERQAITARLIPGAIETTVLDREYDAVIFAPACYSNLQSVGVRIATLSRLRLHLRRGGRLIVSYIASESRSRLAVALMRLSATLTGSDWRPEAGDRFARYPGSRRNLYFEHAFLPGEIGKECTAAGFRVVDEYSNSYRAHCVVLELA